MNLKEVLKTLNARFREKNMDKMDMDLVREYFRIFEKEALLVEWLGSIK